MLADLWQTGQCRTLKHASREQIDSRIRQHGHQTPRHDASVSSLDDMNAQEFHIFPAEKKFKESVLVANDLAALEMSQ